MTIDWRSCELQQRMWGKVPWALLHCWCGYPHGPCLNMWRTPLWFWEI